MAKSSKIEYLWDVKGMLPCPFCGIVKEDDDHPVACKVYANNRGEIFYIDCFNCGCSNEGYGHLSLQQALWHWNSRPLMSASDEFKQGVAFARKELVDLIGALQENSTIQSLE